MKKMYHIITLVILIATSSINFVNAQVNCQRLLKKKISLHDLDSGKVDRIFKDFAQLKACGLDSNALEIISDPPLFASLIIPFMDYGKKTNVTYQHIFDKIIEFQNSDEFPFLKQSHDASKALKNKNVDLKNWIADSKLLLQVPLDSNEIEDFYNYLKANPSKDYTYFDAWGIFKSHATKHQQTSKEMGMEENKNDSPRNIEEALFRGKYNTMTLAEIFVEADSLNRNVVIYFTGWSHIDSRKLEVSLFDDKQLNTKLLREFLFVILYNDDKTRMDEIPNLKKDEYSTGNITIGQRSQKIQLHYLSSKDIPAFILLDSKGKLIKTLSKNINKETLRSFLTN
jgi:hydroxymethylpyrimidine pyrophosphatase-like HAD family hydrolase